MPEISQITLPSGTTYDIKDATARAAISGFTKWLGVTTTALEDGDATNPITINGVSVTATSGDITSYGDTEFIYNGSEWQEFGNLSALGTLAYQNSASATYQPAGSVSQPTFSGSSLTSTGSFTPTGSVAISTGTGTANYTPAGSVSQPTITVTPTTTTVDTMTAVGTLPSWTATVTSENLTIGWSTGTLPTQGSATVMTGASASSSTPSFTGTGVELKGSFTGSSGSVSVTGTPSGTVSQPTFTGTSATITVS